ITWQVDDGSAANHASNTPTTTLQINQPSTGAPQILYPTTEPHTLTADTSAIHDLDGLGTFHFQWERSADGGTTWTPVGTDSNTFEISPAVIHNGDIIDVDVRYTDGGGTAESLTSAPVGPIDPFLVQS